MKAKFFLHEGLFLSMLALILSCKGPELRLEMALQDGDLTTVGKAWGSQNQFLLNPEGKGVVLSYKIWSSG